jgi:hypothetical protein
MGIQVNMNKAKDIWRDKWRQAREPLLKELDIEFMRATELNDTVEQAAVAAKKQELRDVTEADLSASETPELLKQVWPECLGEKLEESK